MAVTRTSRQPIVRSASDLTTFLFRCAGELFYRSSRVHVYVDELSRSVSREYFGLTDDLRKRLRDAETNARQLISDAIEDPRLEPTRNARIFDAIAGLADVFEAENERLALLPPLQAKPEMFAIEEAFGGAPQENERGEARRRYSILLSGVFNAFEFEFDRGFGPSDSKTVLELGMCDFASPPAWAILGHEIGHALNRAGAARGLSVPAVKEVFPSVKSRRLERILRNWAEEAFADFVAARVLGPAPMLALISMEQCTFGVRRTAWSARRRGQHMAWVHPPTHWRALAVTRFLRNYGSSRYLDAAARDFETFTVRRIEMQEDPEDHERYLLRDRIHFEKWFVDLSLAVEKIVTTLDLPRHRIDAPSLKRCDERLRAGYPIGAQGLNRAQLNRNLEDYFRDPAQRGVPRAFYELSGRFDEAPMDLPTILLAAHRRRQTLLTDFTADRAGVTNADKVISLNAALAAVDRTTELSIRMAGVHRHWLSRGNRQPLAEDFEGLATTPLPIHRRVSKTPVVGDEQFLLSDFQILRRLVAAPDNVFFVSPLLDAVTQVGQSSIDVRLGTVLKVTRVASSTHLDLSDTVAEIESRLDEYLRIHQISPSESFVIHPGQFALATTLEYLRFPPDLAGRLEGRSTLARFGLQVHATAGFIDPGYAGTLTFELSNAGNLPIRIPPGYRLGQICLFRVDHVQVPYDRKLHRKYGEDPTGERPLVAKEVEILATSRHRRQGIAAKQEE